MSHNVRLKGVSFSDLGILQAAIDELNQEGARLTLVRGEGEGATFRSWRGRLDKADAAIHVADSPYDIGLTWNAQDQKWEPILEFLFNNANVSADSSAVNVDGEACSVDYNGIKLGKLSQRYAVIQTEINAAKAGKSFQRVRDDQTGQIHLEVNA